MINRKQKLLYLNEMARGGVVLGLVIQWRYGIIQDSRLSVFFALPFWAFWLWPKMCTFTAAGWLQWTQASPPRIAIYSRAPLLKNEETFKRCVPGKSLSQVSWIITVPQGHSKTITGKNDYHCWIVIAGSGQSGFAMELWRAFSGDNGCQLPEQNQNLISGEEAG